MKVFLLLTAGFVLTFGLTAYGQINPNDRPVWSQGFFINFEEVEADTLTVLDFDEAGTHIFEKAANPGPVNFPNDFPYNSATVGEITTTASASEGVQINNEFIIDFSIRPWICMDVYAPAADRTVRLKIENFTDNTIVKEVEAKTTAAGQWETLTFDFSGTESGKYGRILLFMDYGGTNAGDVWYFDNIRQAQPRIGYKTGLIENFEPPNRMYWGDWSDCMFEIIENPDTSGINKSSRVGKFLTNASQWEGACNAERLVPFDLTEGALFSMKVYSSAGSIWMFKLENTYDKTKFPQEVQVTTENNYEWEELTFDFLDKVSGLDDSIQTRFYDRVAIFPDFLATNEDYWYVDDIRFLGKPSSVKGATPKTHQLFAQNYPNPFNPSTAIAYTIPAASKVRLAVYNTLGKMLKVLVDEKKPAGSYRVDFDGSQLTSGVYFYRLETESKMVTGKMLLMK